MQRAIAFLAAFLAVGISEFSVHAADLDQDTKNHYRASDLAPFTSATEWIIFSLDPFPWEDEEGAFAAPAPTDGTETSKTTKATPPKRKVPPDQEFHDYPILGKAKVSVTPELKTVIATLDDAGRHWMGAVANCFNPRHGIRVTAHGVTHDLLICYECSTAAIFEGSNQTGTICFATEAWRTPRPAYLNGALIRARIPLRPPPCS